MLGSPAANRSKAMNTTPSQAKAPSREAGSCMGALLPGSFGARMLTGSFEAGIIRSDLQARWGTGVILPIADIHHTLSGAGAAHCGKVLDIDEARFAVCQLSRNW